jgi:hypothetical protein
VTKALVRFISNIAAKIRIGKVNNFAGSVEQWSVALSSADVTDIGRIAAIRRTVGRGRRRKPSRSRRFRDPKEASVRCTIATPRFTTGLASVRF